MLICLYYHFIIWGLPKHLHCQSQRKFLYKKIHIVKTYIQSLVEDDDVTSAASLQHTTDFFDYKSPGVLIPIWKEYGLNSDYYELRLHTTLLTVSFHVCWKLQHSTYKDVFNDKDAVFACKWDDLLSTVFDFKLKYVECDEFCAHL